MALNIKNSEVEQLASEVARIAGESKTEAIRKALLERKQRLALRAANPDRRRSALRFLEQELWPQVPPAMRGRRPTREEEEEILGYGPTGA